jgi:hypothetical protein
MGEISKNPRKIDIQGIPKRRNLGTFSISINLCKTKEAIPNAIKRNLKLNMF